jgi:DNA-binding beta-propeller fold protein YncE
MTSRARFCTASLLPVLLAAALVVGWPGTAPAQPNPGELFSSNTGAIPFKVVRDPGGVDLPVLTVAEGVLSPRGLAVDPVSGNLFVADPPTHTIFRWSGPVPAPVFADAADGLDLPVGLAFNAAGELFVSDASFASPAVFRFDAAGHGTAIIDATDGLVSPRGVAIDPISGDLFIDDAGAKKVFRWNPVSGLTTFADDGDGIGLPEGLAFRASGELFVSNARVSDASVLRFDAAGLGTTILSIAAGDPLGSPQGLAVHPVTGDLFIADLMPQFIGRIYRLNAAGALFLVAQGPAGADTPYGLAFAPVPPATVAIDIKPGAFPNSVNPGSHGVIAVAVLTSPGFDAATVDPSTVVFGPLGAPAQGGAGHLEDVDGDGDLDLVLHFSVQASGIACGTTSATLTGTTFGGQAIEASDSIRTVPCH